MIGNQEPVKWPPDMKDVTAKKKPHRRKPAGRPPGIIDRRQLLSAIDAFADELQRLRRLISDFTRPA